VGIDNPHLWNGVEDPYLYKTFTVLKRNGKEIDRVEEKIGLRYFHLDPDKGFFLNGKQLKLRGLLSGLDPLPALTENNHLLIIFFKWRNALRLVHLAAKFMFGTDVAYIV
jgi:hypothetical protein